MVVGTSHITSASELLPCVSFGCSSCVAHACPPAIVCTGGVGDEVNDLFFTYDNSASDPAGLCKNTLKNSFSALFRTW